ncbi:MAG: hypothetical protein QMC98_01405, partial [Candidatus Thermoplasmatota archaeon]|nr:hypothetical protein [Candidatus Thermoplasmatota archaeon]
MREAALMGLMAAPPPPPPAAAPKKAIAGFIVSLIGGILMLISAFVYLAFFAFGAALFTVFGAGEIGALLMGIGVAGLIISILVIVGAILLYKGKFVAGGVLTIILSIV